LVMIRSFFRFSRVVPRAGVAGNEGVPTSCEYELNCRIKSTAGREGTRPEFGRAWGKSQANPRVKSDRAPLISLFEKARQQNSRTTI
jgi:hypothetical protein